MPQYRLVYYVVYRLPASSDSQATESVLSALMATFPKAKFDVQGTVQSAVQNQPGKTLYDVQLGASGEVTATSVTNSLTKVTIPATLATSGGTASLVQQIEMASIDTRVEGRF